jgi:aminopeptidase C
MAFKIDIKDLTAWNLIEVNRDYIAAYDKTGNKNWFLKQIEHFQE